MVYVCLEVNMNLPDYIFIDTFENGKLWDEK